MHVLHVLQPVGAGVPTLVRLLTRLQENAGWRVTVAAPEDVAGGRFVRWPATRSPGPATAAEVARLARVIRIHSPDVVHLHSSKAGLAGRAALRGHVPTLFQPHGWSFLALEGAVATLARRWERAAVRWSDRILCCSEGEAEQGRRAGIVPGLLEVVPNPVDLDRFRPADGAERAAVRHRLGVPDGPVVVCLGRLAPQKGQDLLIAAWRRVVAKVPAATLVLVGDGPDRTRLASASGSGVRFVGHQDDVTGWLHAADVVALPSRYEGQSLAVLEAMASGTAVVATDVEGMSEALGDDAGAIVPLGDESALADALVLRLHDPDLAAAEGRAGRARAVRNHDPEAWAERISAVTRSVLR